MTQELLLPFKPDFVDYVILVHTLLLELCKGPPGHRRSKSIEGIHQQGLILNQFQHFVSIFLPVCHHVDVSSLLQLCGKKVKEGRIHDPSLMVLLLWPRIWEEDMESFNAVIRDHMLQDIYSIESHDSDVIDIVLAKSLQELYKAL